MLSQTAEYALRAVVHLAETPLERSTTQQIAEVTRIPRSYLSKVMQALAKGGMVTGQRGLNGGFALTRPPAEISVLEVINAVDPLTRILSCPLGLEAHADRLCSLHSKLDEAIAEIERRFRDTPVSELLSDSTFQSGSGNGSKP